MPKFFTLSLFVIFAMLLAACAPASTPEVVSEPQPPVAEEAPEESMPEDDMEEDVPVETARLQDDVRRPV